MGSAFASGANVKRDGVGGVGETLRPRRARDIYAASTKVDSVKGDVRNVTDTGVWRVARMEARVVRGRLRRPRWRSGCPLHG